MPVTRFLSEGTVQNLIAQDADCIIDQLVTESFDHANNSRDISDTMSNEHQRIHLFDSQSSQWQTIKHRPLSIRWPTQAEFTRPELGIELISEYIEKEWKTTSNAPDPCWVYVVDFLERKSSEFNDLYFYRVRYSLPTRRQPIPKHSVAIFFTIDVSKMKPKDTPVKISFIFETTRIVHYPERFRFHQHLLLTISRLKDNLAPTLDF